MDFIYNKTLPEFEIAPGRNVGGYSSCFIIAEIGQNHQGDYTVATNLIKAASDAGVDCVKFQKSDLESRFTKAVLERPYIGPNSWGATYGEHRMHLELPKEDFVRLKQYANNLGLSFTASGMDKPSLDFLFSIGVPFFKIGSADTTNIPLLRHVSMYNKPLVISTGMTDLTGIRKMHLEVSKLNCSIGLLQCTSCYPTSPGNVNLNVIKMFQSVFPDAVIGYSGHEKGIGVSIAAVASGAKILERHITLSHSLKGSDHISSLEPEELKSLVTEVRNVEEAMGSYKKDILSCELPCYEKLGKTIVATRNLPRGTVINGDMIDVKVAVKKGFRSEMYDDLIGKILIKDVIEEETILKDHFHA